MTSITTGADGVGEAVEFAVDGAAVVGVTVVFVAAVVVAVAFVGSAVGTFEVVFRV